MGRHLRRLSSVWLSQPVYFITTCTIDRKPLLANATIHDVLRNEWTQSATRYAWAIGPYIVMPDHVHFFAAPHLDGSSLSSMVGKWKEWTAKRGGLVRLWQPGFFDHVLRNGESRAAKWDYMRENPVRAGLVKTADEWPFSGWIDFQ
jgi:putative transposase